VQEEDTVVLGFPELAKVGKHFNCQSKRQLVSWKSTSTGFGAPAGLCGLDFAFDIGSLVLDLWVASPGKGGVGTL